MQLATLVFLVRDDNVILAAKKDKVGKGRLNGYGGKVEGGESLRECLVRELAGESKGVIVRQDDLLPRARIKFFNQENNPDIPDMDVMVYVTERFTGKAKESIEMGKAEEYPFDAIPFDQMLPADYLFVPNILRGECLVGEVYYAPKFVGVERFEFRRVETIDESPLVS